MYRLDVLKAVMMMEFNILGVSILVKKYCQYISIEKILVKA